MSDNTSEIEELKKQVLLLARLTVEWLCLVQYRMVLLRLTGEERKSYVDYWGKKLDDALKKIESSTAVEQILDVGHNFEKEFGEYVTAAKVGTADKAMEIAHSFIKKYSPVALPLKAVREGDVWVVDVDVGALAVKIAKVQVDAKTGDILSYDIPEKK